MAKLIRNTIPLHELNATYRSQAVLRAHPSQAAKANKKAAALLLKEKDADIPKEGAETKDNSPPQQKAEPSTPEKGLVEKEPVEGVPVDEGAKVESKPSRFK